MLKGSDDSGNESMWWVPVSYTTSNELNFTDTKPRTWLKAEPNVQLDVNITDDEWVMLNLQVAGNTICMFALSLLIMKYL